MKTLSQKMTDMILENYSMDEALAYKKEAVESIKEYEKLLKRITPPFISVNTDDDDIEDGYVRVVAIRPNQYYIDASFFLGEGTVVLTSFYNHRALDNGDTFSINDMQTVEKAVRTRVKFLDKQKL